MSLHIGNLSSNICRDDLHRVFRRFGRCTVRVKDKYGFVVYDYPASAEKALKTLRGTRICGQALTLSWSNRQPHAMRRFATSSKSHGLPHGSNSMKENADQKLGLYGRRDRVMDSKKADGEIRISSPELVDESKRYVRESSHVSLTDHHRIEGFFRNPLDNDRWGEQVVDSSNENYSEDVMEFDGYEPYNSDGQKELDEHQGASRLASSPSGKNVHERNGSISCGKSENGCFLCGDVGHKMMNCPLELKRREPRYREGLHPSDGTVRLRNQERYREPGSHPHQKGVRDRQDLENFLERTENIG